jgi:uncharacterized protein (DUF952 family)
VQIRVCSIACGMILALVAAAGCTEAQRKPAAGGAAAPVGPIIYHIAPREAWDDGKNAGRYAPDALLMDGSIPCSTRSQLISVANMIFSGRQGLVLLYIDSAKVKPEIRYLDMDGKEPIGPHIYGPLNLDAVVRVADFVPRADGTFAMPPEAK